MKNIKEIFGLTLLASAQLVAAPSSQPSNQDQRDLQRDEAKDVRQDRIEDVAKGEVIEEKTTVDSYEMRQDAKKIEEAKKKRNGATESSPQGSQEDSPKPKA
ncbi:MAG: hypothetical protein FJZ58_06190 [Chlamydiae bacterium]|nr:hypothetical protein [Chlamydiota bacterium]